MLQVLCLVQGGAGQLCSWVASNLTWAAGARLELSISNIQQVIHMVVVLVVHWRWWGYWLMFVPGIVCYWLSFFPGCFNLECGLWVWPGRCLPGLEWGHCQTHKVWRISTIWVNDKSDLIFFSVNQSAVHTDQQVLQWSGLPLPVLANWISPQVSF